MIEVTHGKYGRPLCKNCKTEGECINAYEGPPNYWCPECGSTGPMEDETWDAPSNSAASERAAIVAWLRDGVPEYHTRGIDIIADAIERGEHLKKAGST